MLNILDSKEIITLDKARSLNTKSKALFVITSMTDISNMKGYIYATSSELSSLDNLIELEDKLQKQGKKTIITGTYGNGGGLGVQYEIK